ncbi:hypothetical protein RYX41_11560 [Lactiplantibacillus plantarum]|nr:hypothetical protein [Lactiplantibacillus plantarum]
MIKFDTKAFKNFTDAREKYAQLVKDAAKPEEQQQGFTDMMDALGKIHFQKLRTKFMLKPKTTWTLADTTLRCLTKK